MLSERKDGEVDHRVKIAGRSREFIPRYRDIASLARYSNELMEILFMKTPSGVVMEEMGRSPGIA